MKNKSGLLELERSIAQSVRKHVQVYSNETKKGRALNAARKAEVDSIWVDTVKRR